MSAFQYSKSKIGHFTSHKLQKNDTCISIIAERGACLNSLQIKGKEILWGYSTESELEKMEWAKSAWLIPFPNRLNFGKYVFENKNFQFPINLEPHAIHGFTLFEEFELVDSSVNEEFGSLKFRYEYDGKFDYYPFSFSFEVDFQLSENQLIINSHLKNESQTSIPAGFGWHPYFALGGQVENWQLQVPDCKKVEVNDVMIPTGKLVPFSEFLSKKEIGKTELDTCFKVHTEKPLSITLESPNLRLDYTQQADNQSFPYVQIFIPPNRDCVAIEPMTCGVDAFNQQSESCLLQPNNIIGGKVMIEWKEK